MRFRRNSCSALLILLVGTNVFAARPPNTKSTGTIEIVSLTPEAGSQVDRNVVIKAELRFSIVNFQNKKNRYSISIQFMDNSTRASTFSDGDMNTVHIEKESGTVHMEYPLNTVWDNPKLRKPVTFYFFLLERTGRNVSAVLEQTEETVYQVTE